WEKGGVENFNSLIRRKFPKGTNFDEINDWEIQEAVDWVNNIYRGSLNYLSANEVYNKWVQVNC
ncbi:MAG: IS30 family transposase, partial [Mycoplasmataceae bacterium]|nr:IS30 family transposase [Mycoplasmataceae bacterium]